MTKITYNLSLNCSSYNMTAVEADSYSFGAPIKAKLSSPLLEHTSLAAFTDGWWQKEPNIVVKDNSIASNLAFKVNEEELIANNLSGPSISAINEISLNNNKFKSLFNSPRLGVKSINNGRLSSAFIFKRHQKHISIYDKYEYVDSDTITTLRDSEFTEFSDGEYSYLVFNLNKPIPLFHFKGSKITLGINDYLKSSFNFNTLLQQTGLSQDNFLEACDYLSLNELGIYSWDIKNLHIVLTAKYFPIYPHVTVIADMEDGLYQVGSMFGSVDSNNGAITIDGQFINGLNKGDCKGFYLFYGVIPSVYLDSADLHIKEEELVTLSDNTVSVFDIDTTDNYGQVYISEPLLTLYRDSVNTSTHVDIFLPNSRQRSFIEPLAPLVINGKPINNGKYFFKSDGIQRFEFNTSEHLLNLLSPAIFITDNKITIPSKIVGQGAAVYGLFKYNDIYRAALMSASLPNIELGEGQEKIAEAAGFGEGGYSLGGYGMGQLAKLSSSVTYNIPGQINHNFQQKIILNIDINKDGYEIILPVWTKYSSIKVTEVGIHQFGNCKDWTFVAPDILIFNKDKINKDAKYSIEMEVIASPIIPNLDLSQNTLDLQFNGNPSNEYTNFLGYYLLSGKEIKLRLGYISDIGETVYYDNELILHMILTQNFLQRIITGNKTVIFQDKV